MLNKFCKMPLWECNRTLIRVAQGQEPAELVIRHARLISVTTHEILEDTDIAIACGRSRLTSYVRRPNLWHTWVRTTTVTTGAVRA